VKQCQDSLFLSPGNSGKGGRHCRVPSGRIVAHHFQEESKRNVLGVANGAFSDKHGEVG
jgi:hypothetical protein